VKEEGILLDMMDGDILAEADGFIDVHVITV